MSSTSVHHIFTLAWIYFSRCLSCRVSNIKRDELTKLDKPISYGSTEFYYQNLMNKINISSDSWKYFLTLKMSMSIQIRSIHKLTSATNSQNQCKEYSFLISKSSKKYSSKHHKISIVKGIVYTYSAQCSSQN